MSPDLQTDGTSMDFGRSSTPGLLERPNRPSNNCMQLRPPPSSERMRRGRNRNGTLRLDARQPRELPGLARDVREDLFQRPHPAAGLRRRHSLIVRRRNGSCFHERTEIFSFLDRRRGSRRRASADRILHRRLFYLRIGNRLNAGIMCFGRSVRSLGEATSRAGVVTATRA